MPLTVRRSSFVIVCAAGFYLLPHDSHRDLRSTTHPNIIIRVLTTVLCAQTRADGQRRIIFATPLVITLPPLVAGGSPASLCQVRPRQACLRQVVGGTTTHPLPLVALLMVERASSPLSAEPMHLHRRPVLPERRPAVTNQIGTRRQLLRNSAVSHRRRFHPAI